MRFWRALTKLFSKLPPANVVILVCKCDRKILGTFTDVSHAWRYLREEELSPLTMHLVSSIVNVPRTGLVDVELPTGETRGIKQ